MIDKKEVLKIMELSKLKIEENKIDKFQNDFSQILDYVSELQALDTKDALEMSSSVEISSVERKDEAFKYEGSNLILNEKDGYLLVKKVLKDE